ncbi:thiosulfate sulfurtransferase GlpE [Acrasis kona]|uniref:Thiosulfate sulfurtransferase GlpE n=1 Tax=Acrasis kona TaxID=1008807 RepID=A0AAW2Z772_9EUKA
MKITTETEESINKPYDFNQFSIDSFNREGFVTSDGLLSYDDLEQSIIETRSFQEYQNTSEYGSHLTDSAPTIFDHAEPDHPEKEKMHTGIGSAFRKATTWICHTFNSNALFPNNKYITVEELVELLSLPNPKDRPLLIDARKESEFNESHIEGATNLHNPDKLEEVSWLKDVPDDKLIVSYCAVGLRSGFLAKRLVEEFDHKNTVTLKGAFYRWANKDLPMVDGDNKIVKKVVPHQILARSLLKPEIRTSLFGQDN